MSALERLSEDEMALLAIISDPTGVDLAEFLFVDEEDSPDGCYRLWDFQWPWSHAESAYTIDSLARQTGKSLSVVWKSMSFVFNHPGQEMLVTAPEGSHLDLLTTKLEAAFTDYRLLREMRPAGATNGLRKAPHWSMRFENRATILTRLPQRDGKGVKGVHPVVIEHDEVQDYPYAGYIEMIETIKTRTPGASWRMHGVSKGVGRDLHYRISQGDVKEGSFKFQVLHYIAAHRPSWCDEERQQKIAQYGGDESHPDYQRNVLGLPSESGSVLFVTSRLMACVRMNESAWASEYNDDVYTRLKISDVLASRVESIENLLEFNFAHLADEYVSYWGGADIGFTNDPTEILVFGTVRQQKGPDLDRLLLRVRLERIRASEQVAVIEAIFGHFGSRLRRFGMDKTGVGLPLWQTLKEKPAIADRIAGYNFSERRPVEFRDDAQHASKDPKDNVIERNIKDYSTDQLRKRVDNKLIELPFDDELLGEWNGQTSYIVKTSKNDDGVVRKYGGGACHTLDAARMYAAAKDLQQIEEMLAPKKQVPVLDLFF